MPPVSNTAGSMHESVAAILATTDASQENIAIVPDATMDSAQESLATLLVTVDASQESLMGFLATYDTGTEIYGIKIFREMTSVQESTQLAPHISASRLGFLVVAEGGNPREQKLHITHIGIGSANFTVSSDVSWMTVSPTSGTAPAWVTVKIDRTGVGVGQHTGHITVTEVP